MKLQAASLGAPHHRPAWCAQLAPNPALRFQPRLKIQFRPLANSSQTHPAFAFSSYTTFSPSLSHKPNTIEYA